MIKPLIAFINKLISESFTGTIELSFYKGSISNDFSVKRKERLVEK